MIASLGFKLRCLMSDEVGATAVEYAVMLALIITVVIVAVAAIGLNVNEMFTDFTTKFTAAGS